MTFIRYDIQTGEILAQIQCGADNLNVLATDGTAFLEGNVDPQSYWVDESEFKEREAVTVVSPTIPFMPSEAPVRVLDELPADAAVRVRGTNNMPVEAQIAQAQGGSLSIVPNIVGRYVAQLVGRYTGPEISFEVQPVEVVKARRQDEVTAKKAEQLAGGFLWNGKRWDADAQAQQNVTSMASAVAAGMALPDAFFWTSYHNEDVEIDGAGISALSAAMMTFIFSTHAHARSLKETIEAQASNADVMNVDIDSDWPS
ncbi:DUF4376 domain-containing protein [Novosphingobium sp. PY1]|uniref:DUF4376 domain-containing protein n=1 Tax=Novosphingobium sp. PY1 TaxID=1882221 RepID=UPI001A90AD3A|nr:DUF4376 domain-containing protein [Novosphingobium sp. PY1]GFM27163.1 uncharacterized protein PY1_contig-01-24 [Novosphingobium sp. PY1]